MTPDQSLPFVEDLPDPRKAEPEKVTNFVFAPNRYYLGFWFVPLSLQHSKFGKGGGVSTLVWRKDAEPWAWHIRYCFRHYRVGGVEVDSPWSGKDSKTWYGGTFTGPESEVLEKLQFWLRFMAVPVDGKMLGGLVQGDVRKLWQMIDDGKFPFIHTQPVHTE